MHALFTSYILFSLYAGFAGSTTASMSPASSKAHAPNVLQFVATPVAQAQELSAPPTAERTPRMDLSSYFVTRGARVTARVQNFAPNEWVVLTFGTEARAQQLTNAHGNTEFTFDAPRGGVSFEVTVEGLDSGTTIGRIAKLARAQ